MGNDLSGSVSATGEEDVYGLYTEHELRIDGDLSGSVSATGDDRVYGLYTSGTVSLGAGLSGSVSASSARTGGSYIYGIYSDTFIYLVDALSGSITSSGDINTYGLYSGGGIRLDGVMSGTVSSSGLANVYGLYANAQLAILGGISNTVSSTASGWGAYGLYTDGPLLITDIPGTVSASAGGLAVAVGADGGLTVTVTGTLTATDTSGAGKAYAIAAGHPTGNSWTPGGAANDSVTLGNGADITGIIELGGGSNTLNFVGAGILNGQVRNGGAMTKSGSGTWQTNTLSGSSLDVRQGTLQVNISQIATPSLAITGILNNDGEILLKPVNALASGSSFIAVSSGGMTGAGRYTTSFLLRQSLEGDDIRLTKQSYADLADDRNKALAEALDLYAGVGTGDLQTILSSLEGALTGAEFNDQLSQLGNMVATGLATQTLDMSRFSSLSIQQRMAEVRTYYALLENDDPDSDDPATWPMVASVGDMSGLMQRSPDHLSQGVHLRMLGRKGSMDTHGGIAGYEYGSLLFSGGYDCVVSDNLVIGVDGGYFSTVADYNDTGDSESTADSYSLGLYSSWFKDDWYVDTLVSGAYNQYSVNRNIPSLNRTASSESNGYTATAKVAGGRRFLVGEYGLTPISSLEYTRFHQDGYTESGAGAANLTVRSVDSNFLESGLGGKVDRVCGTSWGYFIPEVSATWKHEWLTQNREFSVSMSGLPGVNIGQETAEAANDSVLLSVGFQVLGERGCSLGLHYNLETEVHAFSQSGQLDLQLAF